MNPCSCGQVPRIVNYEGSAIHVSCRCGLQLWGRKVHFHSEAEAALSWDARFPLASEPHWNSPDVLPPVGCPIVLHIGCAVVQAERTAHIERRDREMTYKLPTGQELVGRYEWSYP